MTSRQWNIFHVSGSLFPSQRASIPCYWCFVRRILTEWTSWRWCFLWWWPKQTVEQTTELLVVWDVMRLMWQYCNVFYFNPCTATSTHWHWSKWRTVCRRHLHAHFLMGIFRWLLYVFLGRNNQVIWPHVTMVRWTLVTVLQPEQFGKRFENLPWQYLLICQYFIIIIKEKLMPRFRWLWPHQHQC